MFSIIMPVYNTGRFLAVSIESVLHQTYQNFELIIIDDGSSDDSVAIAEQYQKSDDRIKFFKQDHKGVSAARNLGLEVAGGEYVLFIDSDDTWKNNLLKKCGECLKDSAAVIFGMENNYYRKDGSLANVSGEFKDNIGSVCAQTVDDCFSSLNMASPCNKVYVLDIIRKNKCKFSEKCVYLEDLKFNFDYFAGLESATVIRENFYCYRLDAEANQIKKRQFKGIFDNSNELYFSFLNISKCISVSNIKKYSNVVINTYLQEARFWKDSGGYSYKKVVKLLNSNDGFVQQCKINDGKLNKLIYYCKQFKFYLFEWFLIKFRTNN